MKINKSILIICMISLFLIIGQISASDIDSMAMHDNDADSMIIDDIDTSTDPIECDLNTDKSNQLEKNDSTDLTDEDSLELMEKAKDTTGIVMANGDFSCGPASLATVLNKKGLNLSLNEVSEYANTSINGTSMQSLIDAARYYGFNSYGIETETRNLKENYIVHLNINGCEHWTVISKLTDTHVFLDDSTEGNINFTIDEFNSYFSKKAILISSMNSADLEKEIISNQGKILDKDQCSSISGKGLKKKVVGYRIVWKYGFIQKYGWVLKPKVVGGHVSFSQWQYVKGYYSVWGKYKVKEPIYKYYFVSDESLTSTTVKNNKK